MSKLGGGYWSASSRPVDKVGLSPKPVRRTLRLDFLAIRDVQPALTRAHRDANVGRNLRSTPFTLNQSYRRRFGLLAQRLIRPLADRAFLKAVKSVSQALMPDSRVYNHGIFKFCCCTDLKRRIRKRWIY